MCFLMEVRFANQGYSVADLSINYYFVMISSVQKSRAQVAGWLLLFPLTVSSTVKIVYDKKM
jgi:hypothetical protein